MKHLSIWLLVGAMGLVSACGAAPEPPPAEAPSSAEQTDIEPEMDAVETEAQPVEVAQSEVAAQPEPTEETAMSTSEPAEEVAVVVPTDEAVIVEPTEAPAVAEEATPTPRPLDQLIASNPASFQRASGEVQLVEFFAFW